MKKLLIIFLSLLFMPGISYAWWNNDWSFRKKMTINTTPTGVNVTEPISEFPVLVRLHPGNFKFFLDMKPDGSDIRFIASDDKTPLKFHIDKFDAINEMLLIWVKLPTMPANSNAEYVWMYYGNPNAVNAADAAGTYGVNQLLDYHFKEGDTVPLDSTAYGLNATKSAAIPKAAGLIGASLEFKGEDGVTLPESPNLHFKPENGLTYSSWVRLTNTTQDAVIFELNDDSRQLLLGHDPSGLYARITTNNATLSELRAPLLKNDTWQHVSLLLSADKLRLVLDGAEVGAQPVNSTEFGKTATLGMSAKGEHKLSGELDEVQIANTVRSQAWLATLSQSQGQANKLVSYSEDESHASGGGTSYIGIIMKNVTMDGWVVIIILFIMAVISWVVMSMKWIYLSRVRKDNTLFMQQFSQLGSGDPTRLDVQDSAEDKELQNSPIAAALFGSHDHFQSSPLYHLYHRGIAEVKARIGASAGAQTVRYLSPETMAAIRAALDAMSVRESHKLNNLMVLLTIAISGGPFLGLLGTVVGVMITFAAIAASGDVNINAIAPGIAAALLATVAGLVVAIPSLFGYNYLGSYIKQINADIHVFNDEFITRVAEYYVRANGG